MRGGQSKALSAAHDAERKISPRSSAKGGNVCQICCCLPWERRSRSPLPSLQSGWWSLRCGIRSVAKRRERAAAAVTVLPAAAAVIRKKRTKSKKCGSTAFSGAPVKHAPAPRPSGRAFFISFGYQKKKILRARENTCAAGAAKRRGLLTPVRRSPKSGGEKVICPLFLPENNATRAEFCKSLLLRAGFAIIVR